MDKMKLKTKKLGLFVLFTMISLSRVPLAAAEEAHFPGFQLKGLNCGEGIRQFGDGRDLSCCELINQCVDDLLAGHGTVARCVDLAMSCEAK